MNPEPPYPETIRPKTIQVIQFPLVDDDAAPRKRRQVLNPKFQTPSQPSRCSKFNSSTMKQLLASAANVVPQSIDKAILFTVGGVSKIFVGEIVDNARLVRREWGDDENEPLQPRCNPTPYTLHPTP